MSTYVPVTREEEQAMLEACGLSSLEDLYGDVPASVRLREPLNIPQGMAEMQVRREHLESLKAERRTMIFYEAPHKLLRTLEDLLDCSDEFFAARGMLPDDYYQALYVVGQIHFAFLLSTPELERFTYDVVSDRKLTETMISLDVRWATQYLEGFSLEEQQTFADNVAVVMGGMYELLYRKLSAGTPIDPEEFQRLAMNLFVFIQGIPADRAEALFPPDLLTPADFSEAIRFLTGKLF